MSEATETITHSPTPCFSDNEQRWQALVTRDKSADGLFVYSVQTTGVYCRPTCPSKLAKRENVRFHESCDDAERCGYRPCKRCRPREPGVDSRYAAIVEKVCRLIEGSESTPNLSMLSAAVGLSTFHFQRIFKSVTGITPKRYAATCRTKRIQEKLMTENTVTDSIYSAGYNSSSRFYENSDQILGMTPTVFRSGAKDQVIRFAVGPCWLGSVLVAATQKGICAILLGDDPEYLVRELQNRFPKADFIGSDAEFEKLVGTVIGFIDNPTEKPDLPLDICGTAFQRQVWEALQEIPFGTTVSYTDIATKIGNPKSVRAVAQACGANHIAVVIPCHRVVRNDGSLSGYRWGVERKQQLLDREQG